MTSNVPDRGGLAETHPGSAPPRRWPTVVATCLALLLGAGAALSLLVAFTVAGDPCPGFADEGAMAAPDSPYAEVMCEPVVTVALVPMSEVPVHAALLVSSITALCAAVILVRRRQSTSRRGAVVGLVGIVLVQPLIVVALEHTLPRDCLSGRTDTGACSRDRELR